MKSITFIAMLLFSVCAAAQSTLDIYFIDVEGGQATLFVTPQKESLLVDTGWDGHDSRDAKRIAAAAKLAGLRRIDYVVITHYHDDHVGGVPQLLREVPVGTFIDHGPLYEQCASCVTGYGRYLDALSSGNSKRLSVSVGQALPLKAIFAEVISSNGSVLRSPLPGAGAKNGHCDTSEVRPPDVTENSHSVGMFFRFGRFRTIDLGDLTWDKERALMCPANKVGEVSLLIVSHHGWNQSSSPALVSALRPHVAVMDNGARKGGSPPTFVTLKNTPELQALFQLHRSDEAKELNAPEEYIANLNMDDAADVGNYLKVSARRDGSFNVFNSRTGKIVDYPVRGIGKGSTRRSSNR